MRGWRGWDGKTDVELSLTCGLSQSLALFRLYYMSTLKLKQRFNAAMVALEVASRGLSTRERLLVQVFASKVNGCSFCLDMHSREAAKKGVDLEPRSERERMILRVTEMGTRLDSFDDALLDEALEMLGESDLADLIAAIATINAWNRVGRLSRK